MTKETPAEFRARWAAALRSGEYPTGRMALNNAGKYCCLGVACEILNYPKEERDQSGVFLYKGRYGRASQDSLPNDLEHICNSSGDFRFTLNLKSPSSPFKKYGKFFSLIEINDNLLHRQPFPLIADIIEKHPWLLKNSDIKPPNPLPPTITLGEFTLEVSQLEEPETNAPL